jgi:hypothetical protein
MLELQLTEHEIYGDDLPTAPPASLPVVIQPEPLKPTELLIRYLAGSYVRRENRFYHLDRPHEPLSRTDLELAFLHVAKGLNPQAASNPAIMKEVFQTAIATKQADHDRCIPVWGGSIRPFPGNPKRIIPLDNGTVCINSWKQPDHRNLCDIAPDFGIFGTFFDWVFPNEAERTHVLDWLAWSLQNEMQKPSWALFLYSKQKGTGKSTFTDIARHLFGLDNTVSQNNVEKLTSKFNAAIIASKLVICEEVNLRPDSPQSNAMKTFITEASIMTERKGREAERVPLVSSFILTSNHLPLWMEQGERRYYALEVNHDGHAGGPRSAEFSDHVGQVVNALQDDEQVAALYFALMTRQLADNFRAFSLNTAVHSTDLMRRLRGAEQQPAHQQLEEFVNREGRKAMSGSDLRTYAHTELHMSVNAIRPMMMELGWSCHSVKWGGKDYARSIWVRPGYDVADGNIYAADGTKEALCDQLWDAT